MKDTKAYWNKKLVNYSEEDWSNKPSIFAEFSINHFPKDGMILELASGLGQDGRYFAEEGYRVVQTDFSDTALESLHSKRINGIEIQPLDMSKPLEFESEIFDVVYCHLGVHYFTKDLTTQLFQEIHRVLKPKGILALLTNSSDDPEIDENKKIEHGLYQFNDLEKRYFSTEDMKEFAKDFNPIILDNKGTTYKDTAMGVFNLIRFIGQKK